MASSQSESIVNGAVGLMEHHSEWKLFGGQRFLANVEIAGESTYKLEFCIGSSGRVQSYRLLDQYERVKEEWSFVRNWAVMTLDLYGQLGHGPNKFEYRIGVFGGKSFITEKGKKKLYMTLTEHSRAFEIEGMFFKHIDYQSKIHFRCPRESVNQAILVANLLFNLQMNDESGTCGSLPTFGFS